METNIKIKEIIEHSEGTMCYMDDESLWLRNKEGIWSKQRLSKEELQNDFNKYHENKS